MRNIKKILFVMLLILPTIAFADSHGGNNDMLAIGAAIAIGVAALGGALGQAKAAGAALESIGRNPSASGKVFIPMILSLVLIETLVILSFVIAIQLVGLIG